jgi:hypothetical protein
MVRQNSLTMNDSTKIEKRRASVKSAWDLEIRIGNCIPAARGCTLSAGQEAKMQIQWRTVMRRSVLLALIVVLAGVAPSLYGQDRKAEIQKRLASEFTRTKMTGDKSDIVTAGSVLVLHKDNLLMCSTEAVAPPTNTYKDGRISMGFGSNMSWGMALSAASQQAANIPQRKFVAGEKFWVTEYLVKDDGVVFQFYSDPFDNIRYYTQLKFPFQKGSIPAADDLMKTIADVLTVDASQQDAPAQDAAAPQSQAAPAEPAAAPKTIALGQTTAEVLEILGQPTKIVNLGAKQMFFYPDMKVIFTNGKVSDVQ